MRLKFENEILDQQKRKQVILEIESSENLRRKDESYRRYLCYKDQTLYYVIENLLRQFDFQTVLEMRYSISNISLVRKVIDKLSRVYSSGVKRTVSSGKDDGTTNEEATKVLEQLEKELDLNSKLKTANRYLKLHRNMSFYNKPCPVYSADGQSVQWCLKPEVLQPHHYDVIENYFNRSEAMVHILSDYRPRIQNFTSLDPGVRPQMPTVLPKGDGVDQTIADVPEDEGAGEKKKYIWWSENFHFTTDANGEIIPDPGNPGNENPFKTRMIVDYSIDSDNSFWAQGGQDLVDGGILINSMITHNNNVGIVQGYGQFYMTGTNLPKSIKVGPTKAIQIEYQKDEQAEPKLGFLSANPQLADLMKLVEAYVALLLTTNNLSTSGVSAQLAGGKDFASGISMIIDKAESLEDVSDQQQIFKDKEPCILEGVKAFLDTYRDQLVDCLKDLALPENLEQLLSIEFVPPSPIQSEAEKLANYKTRMDLGLDNIITILMKDQPGLTEEQAKEKLLEMMADEIELQMQRQQGLMESGLPVPGQALDANGQPIQPQDQNIEADPFASQQDPAAQNTPPPEPTIKKTKPLADA